MIQWNFHDPQPKLPFLTWVNFYCTLLVLLTVILIIHLAGFWFGPSSTPPKWKPLLWEVSGLETIQSHPNHTTMELKGYFIIPVRLSVLKKLYVRFFNQLNRLNSFIPSHLCFENHLRISTISQLYWSCGRERSHLASAIKINYSLEMVGRAGRRE